MVFSSFVFLFLFLPACLAGYFTVPRKLKNLWLLICSALFYAWGAPDIFFLFFLSCAVDYLIALALDKAAERRRRILLGLSIVFNAGSLFYFKYANFFVHEAARLMEAAGLQAAPWTAVALPIGISFFTFHKLSYVIDVFRGTSPAARSFVDFALYIAFFPQLIAGPIIRYHDIADQLRYRPASLDDIFFGMSRFSIGLGKKVLIADAMGKAADNVFGLDAASLTTPYAWLGIVCYAFQIYFDFSGYSDMAIGLARIMGFRFLENFDRPYISQTFTEFWRRWHISLSRWMRDYLYIPLGGNRVSSARTYFNLWLVFLVSGLWHGASWTFVVWGAYHGFFLCLDKLVWLKVSERLPKTVNIALTFVLVLIGWVFFRSASFSEAVFFLERMFNPQYWTAEKYTLRAAVINDRAVFVLAAAACFSFLPAFSGLEKMILKTREHLGELPRLSLQFSAGLACLLLSVFALSSTNYSPFIYFRF